MNIKSKVGILLVLALATTAVFSFQNCSATSFGVVDSSILPGEQAKQPIIQNPFESKNRIQTFLPEGTTSQTNQKVKALLIVDNSATMNASQTNLSNNISVLLQELQKYDSEIQIVSTTYSSGDCNMGSTNIIACHQSALFYHTPYSQTDAGDGWWRTSSFNTANSINTFFTNSAQTAEQKAQVKTAIENKIKSFGTVGTDFEAPFAVAVAQASSFFKDGDRGLIFILTDENDAGSAHNLGLPIFKSIESKSVTIRPEVPGFYYTKYGKQYYYQHGVCSIYNEFNQYVGSTRIELGQGGSFNTASECEADIPNRTGCSLTCTPYSTPWPSYGALEGRTLAQACSEVTLYPGETMGSCVAGTVTLNQDTYESRNRVEQYLLNIEETKIIEAKSLGSTGIRDLYISKFKTDILSKLSGRYLISVMANVENQSCQMGTGQSKDEFFKSIQSQFPAANFKIDSICKNEASSEGIAKVAADFNYIANTKYNLNLLENEFVVSAKLVLSATETIELAKDTDYRVEQGQFIILKSGVSNFVRIDVHISTK